MSSNKPKVAALQMKPTTVTTGFGTGSYNPATGNVGYTLDDQLAQLRDVFYGAADQFLPTEQQQQFAQQVGDYGRGLFNNAMNLDVGGMTQNYYNSQQDILRNDRELESSRLADQQFGTGRLGFGVGTQGGYINPQQYALQMARENQNSQLMLGAEDRARNIQTNQLQQGVGLLDAESSLRLNPYNQANSLFGLGAGIEGLGMQSLDVVGQFAPLQMQWQQAQQQNQQAMNNAKASGGFMGGLGGTLLNTGLNYAAGSLGSSLGTSLGKSLGNWAGGLVSTNPANALNTYSNPYTSAFGTTVA